MVAPGKKPTVQGFLYALVTNWASVVSGALSVPFTIASIYSSNLNTRVTFALLAIAGVVVASHRVWALERRERIKAQEELGATRERLETQARLHAENTHQTEKRKALKQQLAEFLTQGRNIQHHFEYSNLNSPREKTEWESRVEAYLKKELDESYAARFRSPNHHISSYPAEMDVRMREQWANVTAKMAMLGDFMSELGRRE